MGTLLVDIRHAARALARMPAYTAVLLLMLTLGIGATTATFTLVDAALLRPLPYRDADRLVVLFEGIPKAELPQLPFSAPDLRDFGGMQHSFSTFAAFKTRDFELSGTGEPERLTGARVSSRLFDTLGLQPALGRFFTPEEDAPGHRLVVLSYGYWQRRFGGDRGILGRSIRLDREAYTVIGVAPRGITFPHPGLRFAELVRPAVLFVPMAFTPLELESRGMMFNNLVIGRLADAATVESARAELAVLAPRIQRNYPPILRDGPYQLVLSLTPLGEAVSGAVARPLTVLLGAVGLVLLVTCANAANLSLSRAGARRHELAVRAVLGASRGRLVQVLLSESAIVAVVSGVLGLALARASVRLVASSAAAALPVDDVGLSAPVVLFAGAVTALTMLLVGVMPLMGRERVDAESALREGAARTTAGPARMRLQRALVAATAALAVVLLVGAGLLVRSFERLVSASPGFGAESVLTFAVTLPNLEYREPRAVKTFVATLRQRMQHLPSVEAATVSTAVPTLFTEQRAFTPEVPVQTDAPESVVVTWAEGDYFRVLGVPLLRGRGFSAADGADAPQVAVISHSLARRHWPGRDPVGQRLKWGVAQSAAPWMTIVGVAGDVNDGPLGSRPRPHVYVPYAQFSDEELREVVDADSPFGRGLIVALRSPREPGDLARAAIAEVHSLDPALAVSGTTTMGERLASGVAPQRFSMALLAAFAGVALFLAAVGLYGVLALGVTQRTRELGVRLALGARREDVVALVMRQGVVLVAIGLLGGLVAAATLSRVLRSVLYETTPYDPVAFVAGPLVLATIAVLASYLPARRAGRVDPVVALRVQ